MYYCFFSSSAVNEVKHLKLLHICKYTFFWKSRKIPEKLPISNYLLSLSPRRRVGGRSQKPDLLACQSWRLKSFPSSGTSADNTHEHSTVPRAKQTLRPGFSDCTPTKGEIDPDCGSLQVKIAATGLFSCSRLLFKEQFGSYGSQVNLSCTLSSRRRLHRMSGSSTKH